MVVVKIEDLIRYSSLNPLFSKAFDWLKTTDLTKTETGKVVIDGQYLFANVQKYDTKSVEEAAFEQHRKYIDIQVVVSGAERMDIADAANLTVKDPYNAEKDMQKFTGDYAQSVALTPGYACILFPEDAHRPCVHPDGKTKTQVHKICMKIRL